jgi:hypothetical protein
MSVGLQDVFTRCFFCMSVIDASLAETFDRLPPNKRLAALKFSLAF